VKYAMFKGLIVSMMAYVSLCSGAAEAPQEAIELAPNVEVQIFGEWMTTPPYPTLTQWLLQQHGNWIQHHVINLRGHNDRINAVAISPDGTKVATGSHGHTAKIWDIGNIFAELKKLTIKQISLLNVIREFALKQTPKKLYKLDLTKEDATTIKYLEQFRLLPGLVRDLVSGFVVVPE